MSKLVCGPLSAISKALLVSATVLSLSAQGAEVRGEINAGTVGMPVEEQRLEADVRFLASDLLEGREAGTRGYDIAASFVAERYRSLGLKPAPGQSDYFQHLTLQDAKVSMEFGGLMTLSGAEAPSAFEAGIDYVGRATGYASEVTIEAPIVFVGYGFVSEKYQRNDYEGLDVKGKIVAYFIGAPNFLDSEERAYYSEQRAKEASDRGAIATLSLLTPSFEQRYAFEKIVENTAHSSQSFWLDQKGRAYNISPNIQARAVVSLNGGSRLFGERWDKIAEAAESPQGEMASFEMDVSARLTVKAIHSEVRTANVVGYLEGSDAQLKNETVVISGHMDHEGIKESEEEGADIVYNGAMDNATGVASILELARIMSQNPPRRSVLFMALTAEEKGLLGSDYFANNPVVPIENIVANINLDMPILNFEFQDVIVYGVERSTMRPVVKSAVEAFDLSLSPDPMPEQGIFTRSDHYSFVKQGVPAVYLNLGYANGGEAAQTDFIKHHYHEPSDEIEKVSFRQLRRFTEVNMKIVEGVANMDERPLWKRDDFFGKAFNGPMEK